MCDSPPTAAAPPLEQAVASPVHGSYEKLPVAAGTTAPQWAATSLSKVVAAIPTDAGPARTPAGTAPQSGSGGATASEDPDTDAAGTATADTGTGATAASEPATTATGTTGEAGAATTTPPASGTGGSYEDGGSAGDGGSSAITPTNSPSGSSATGGTGAGASTRPSGSASSDGAGASGSTRTGSTGTGSDTSGTVSSGQRSAETSSPPSSRTGAADSAGGYGTGSEAGAGSTTSGTGTGTTSSSAPSSQRSTSGSTSEDPPTTTAAAPSSRSRGSEKADEDKEKDKKDGGKAKDKDGGKAKDKDGGKAKDKDQKKKGGGTTTDASFSLAGGLEGFKSTPWNNQGATDPSAATSPNVPGREAVKFEMPGGGKRTEAEPDIPEFTEGETSFVGYSGFFGQGFPTNTDTWQLIMQFKQPGTGSPPLAVEVGKGQLRLANDGGSQKDFCPVTQGAFSFQLGVTFGGGIDAWCNGKQTLTGYRTPKSNVQGSAYLKTGIYRDESIKQDSTLFMNDLKVGKSLESVSGLAGAGNGTDAAATATTNPPTTTDPPTTGGTSDQAAGPDQAGSTTPAPAAAAPDNAAGTGTADALGTGMGAGSSGTGPAAADANSYFTGGVVGPLLPGSGSASRGGVVTRATGTADPGGTALAYRPAGGPSRPS